jgi:hypothetical protein
MTLVLTVITARTHAFWSGILPPSVLALDRVRFHHTHTPQTYRELAVTLGLYAGSVFVFTTMMDLVVCRPLTRWWLRRCTRQSPSDRAVKKTGWYLLHAIFNCMLVGVSYREAWEAFRDPARGGYTPSHWRGSHPASLFSAAAISAFVWHRLISRSDVIGAPEAVKLLTGGGAVAMIGTFCPWGRFFALSNMSISGPPGAVYSALVWAQVPQATRKRVNRIMNLVVRYPVQLLSAYAAFVAHASGNAPVVDTPTATMMILGMTARTLDALQCVIDEDALGGMLPPPPP